MTIALDFVQHFEGKVAAVAAQSTATFCTVPLATADWPLQSGRMVSVDADFAGLESSGMVFRLIVRAIIPHGLATNHAALNSTNGNDGCFVESVFSTPASGNSNNFVGYGTINASGDLDVIWSNQNAPGSGITQDVAVRVTVRWLGS